MEQDVRKAGRWIAAPDGGSLHPVLIIIIVVVIESSPCHRCPYHRHCHCRCIISLSTSWLLSSLIKQHNFHYHQCCKILMIVPNIFQIPEHTTWPMHSNNQHNFAHYLHVCIWYIISTMMIDSKIYSSRFVPSHKTVGLRESISFGNDLLTINEMKKMIRKVWIENNKHEMMILNS